MFRPGFICACLVILVAQAAALFQGAHQLAPDWAFVASSDNSWKAHHTVKFVVALKKRNVEEMHNHLLRVSDPSSADYGKYLKKRELATLYGPSADSTKRVTEYFGQIRGARLRMAEHGDLLEVEAKVTDVESHLKTKLEMVAHKNPRLMPQRALRSTEALNLPHEVAEEVKFVSLNSPVNFLRARAGKALKAKAMGNANEAAAAAKLSVTGGNEAALTTFSPLCADGRPNVYNPPCSGDAERPVFHFEVTSHNNDPSNPFLLSTAPYVFDVPSDRVYCYNSATKDACSGVADSPCACITQLAPLPKYVQLKIAGSAIYGSGSRADLGASDFFALTDVATPRFLSELYNVPTGMRVNHGSNQSVAEFYGEFYSNADLEKFFQLSGLSTATIPKENVLGDLPNDESNPGGEAQLDVEYLMALAPGAETYFYSMKDYNPNDPAGTTEHNEGFLTYLLTIDEMDYPPLVHSLSYGDVEAIIFNTSHPGSAEYGTACDLKFLEYGLRGLSFLVSSGDDGIGGSFVRDDPQLGCSQAWPAWPASSPYVTAVGATQLTDKYLPMCGLDYAIKDSASYSSLPQGFNLPAQCTGTGETVCSANLGGVITSGGGFSDFHPRSLTPWQEAAVSKYLGAANKVSYPASSGYFNAGGRGYPDVATYGSNYFVYLDGKITRESGTSASAPVFAAMVTLWNDIRLASGKPPMGFIAPFLYSIHATHPEAFNDVVTGDNACSVGSSMSTTSCCTEAFAASPGWDAVTGLGSPNFEVIAQLVRKSGGGGGAEDDDFSGNVLGGGAGASATDSDNETTSNEALAGVVMGSLAFAMAVAALALVLSRMSTFEKRTQREEASNSLMSSFSSHNQA